MEIKQENNYLSREDISENIRFLLLELADVLKDIAPDLYDKKQLVAERLDKLKTQIENLINFDYKKSKKPKKRT